MYDVNYIEIAMVMQTYKAKVVQKLDMNLCILAKTYYD